MEKESILVLRPYDKHTVGSGIVYSLDETRYNIFSANFQEKGSDSISDPSELTNKLARDPFLGHPPEAETLVTISEEDEREYVRQINEWAQETNASLIIPVKEKYINFLSKPENRASLEDRLFLPSNEVIETFLSKAVAYDFFKPYEESTNIRVPVFTHLERDDYTGIERLFAKNGTLFVKPSIGSGGKGAARIQSFEDYKAYEADLDEQENGLVFSEVLELPEINHTIVIQNGEIRAQGSYMGLERTAYSPSSTNITLREAQIEAIAEDIKDVLVDRFGVKGANGVYNFDFLRRADGTYVVNDFNVGRLPGGNSTFVGAGLNFTEEIIKAHRGEDFDPNNKPTYTVGYKFNPETFQEVR